MSSKFCNQMLTNMITFHNVLLNAITKSFLSEERHYTSLTLSRTSQKKEEKKIVNKKEAAICLAEK